MSETKTPEAKPEEPTRQSDEELLLLARFVRELNKADEATRHRVVSYLSARYLLAPLLKT